MQQLKQQYPLLKILVTGGVCTGKTTISTSLLKKLQEVYQDMKYINISDVVINNKLFKDYDKDYKTYIPNEDRLLQFMAKNYNKEQQAQLVDHHSFDIFGSHYFDFIVQIRCIDKDGDLVQLRKRLFERNYPEKKIYENIDVELEDMIGQQIKRFKCQKIVINNNGTLKIDEIINQVIDKMDKILLQNKHSDNMIYQEEEYEEE